MRSKSALVFVAGTDLRGRGGHYWLFLLFATSFVFLMIERIVTHCSEGVWRIGGVTFRGEVTIVRVLDDSSADFDVVQYREQPEEALAQESVLIVRREVAVL